MCRCGRPSCSGYGSSTIDKSGNLLTDGPAAIEAAKTVSDPLMTTAATTGVAGFNWAESQSASSRQGSACG